MESVLDKAFQTDHVKRKIDLEMVYLGSSVFYFELPIHLWHGLPTPIRCSLTGRPSQAQIQLNRPDVIRARPQCGTYDRHSSRRHLQTRRTGM